MDFNALDRAAAEISSLNDELTDAYKKLDAMSALLDEARALLGSATKLSKERFSISAGGTIDLYMRIVEVLK